MSDHVVLSFSIYERFKYRRDTSRLMYSYKHTNVNGLIDDLTNSKLLSTVQLANSVDDAWSEWLHLVNDAIDKNVPKRIVKNNSGPAWVDSELRQLQKEKLKAHRKAKRTGGSEDWLNFRHVRNKVNSLCRSKHKLFIQNLEIEVNSNPKKFWSYVKSKTGSRVIPPDMIYNGVKLSSPDAQASGFNEYFHTTFSNPLNATCNDHDTDPHQDLNYIIVTELEVTGILQKLNVNKSCGPDDVSPVILKCFSSVTMQPF